MFYLRRISQTLFLLAFILSLLFAEKLLDFGISPTLFLASDPVAGILLPVISHSFLWILWPAFLIIILTIIFGRFFCGWICPTGTTLNIMGVILRKGFFDGKILKKITTGFNLYLLKYLILLLITIAAFFEINLIYWGSPLSLAARLYGLVIFPSAQAAGDYLLEIADPVLRWFGSDSMFFSITEPHFFSTTIFIVCFWILLFLLEIISPRFWCRFLCPAGALLSLFASFPLFRRYVSTKCNNCGKCNNICPAGVSNHQNNKTTRCFVCGACTKACKLKATGFHFRKPAFYAKKNAELFQQSRRSFLAAGIGATLIGGSIILFETSDAVEAPVVRPPGAQPDPDFLNLCIRCGECISCCPTGGLEPIRIKSGEAGIFSPKLDPYSGGCLPDCIVCGSVCPTQAILPLTLAQKYWAKIGTAVIDKNDCLAWHDDKRCMVCKENCPWNAVDVIVRDGNSVPVPVVRTKSCFGCGFCQKACPKSPAAIVVKPINAVRLKSHLFEEACREAGLDLQPNTRSISIHESEGDDQTLPPGFLE